MDKKVRLPWPLRMSISILIFMGIAATKNSFEEHPYYPLGDIAISCIWILAPGLVIGMRSFAHRLGKESSLLDWVVFIYCICLSPIYGYYGFNGQADPDTAGHLHLFIVPMAIAILTIPLGFLVIANLLFISGD